VEGGRQLSGVRWEGETEVAVKVLWGVKACDCEHSGCSRHMHITIRPLVHIISKVRTFEGSWTETTLLNRGCSLTDLRSHVLTLQSALNISLHHFRVGGDCRGTALYACAQSRASGLNQRPRTRRKPKTRTRNQMSNDTLTANTAQLTTINSKLPSRCFGLRLREF
jgi:hypothetical protein